MRWLNSITGSMDLSLSILREMVKDRDPEYLILVDLGRGARIYISSNFPVDFAVPGTPFSEPLTWDIVLGAVCLLMCPSL